MMNNQKSKKLHQLVDDAEYLEQAKTKREIAKTHQMMEQKNNKIMLDCLTKITKRKAEELGKSELLNFYGNNCYEEYFADYVRFLSKDKKISTKEAIETLNDDLIKNTNGNFIDSLRKAHNIQNAYINFKNASAYVETRLAKEYGEENYYEMATSKNPSAVEAYNKFQKWAVEKDKVFKDALKLDEEFMKVRTSNNPMEELSKDGILLGTATVVFSAISVIPIRLAIDEIRDYLWRKKKDCLDNNIFYYTDVLPYSLMASLMIFAGVCVDSFVFKTKNDYTAYLNGIADKYGLDNASSLVNFLKESNYTYLTPEEVKQLEEAYSYNVKELVAKNAGYNSLEEALYDIDLHSEKQVAGREDVLHNIAQERALANDMFAKENGFVSYDELVKYLNNHKILEGEYIHGSEGFGKWGAGWSIYNYDTVNAKIIANELTLLDNHYDSLTSQIQENGLYQNITKYDNQDIQQLVYNLNAYDSVTTSKFDFINSNNDLSFYSPNKFAYYAGNEALNLSQDNGFDVITQLKYHWGLKLSEKDVPTVENLHNSDKFLQANSTEITTNSIVGESVTQNIADSVENSVAQIAGASGLVLGAGLSMAVKCNRQIVDTFKQRKVNKNKKELEKINNQVKEDELRR